MISGVCYLLPPGELIPLWQLGDVSSPLPPLGDLVPLPPGELTPLLPRGSLLSLRPRGDLVPLPPDDLTRPLTTLLPPLPSTGTLIPPLPGEPPLHSEGNPDPRSVCLLEREVLQVARPSATALPTCIQPDSARSTLTVSCIQPVSARSAARPPCPPPRLLLSPRLPALPFLGCPPSTSSAARPPLSRLPALLIVALISSSFCILGIYQQPLIAALLLLTVHIQPATAPHQLFESGRHWRQSTAIALHQGTSSTNRQGTSSTSRHGTSSISRQGTSSASRQGTSSTSRLGCPNLSRQIDSHKRHSSFR